MSDSLQERAIHELVANGGTVANAMRKAGYSPRTARTPKKLTDSIAFKKKFQPYAERLKKHQEKILQAMEAKDLSKEQYKVLSESLAKTTHDVQLLTGKSTENVQVRPILDV